MAVNIEFENISSLDCKDRKSGRVQKKGITRLETLATQATSERSIQKTQVLATKTGKSE